MGTYSTAAVLGEDVLKVKGTVEAEGAVIVDINPVNLVVARGVQNGDLCLPVSCAVLF
jgi:hypothetical protein